MYQTDAWSESDDREDELIIEQAIDALKENRLDYVRKCLDALEGDVAKRVEVIRDFAQGG